VNEGNRDESNVSIALSTGAYNDSAESTNVVETVTRKQEKVAYANFVDNSRENIKIATTAANAIITSHSNDIIFNSSNICSRNNVNIGANGGYMNAKEAFLASEQLGISPNNDAILVAIETGIKPTTNTATVSANSANNE
jgi:hypothetical protein